ncbi:proteasome-activating nucleotidase [Ignicoccus hospitalis]|uniref:Proteasome-activating nucleotidase n=1 Tax=Ignicoccus hospitalis (strain KIN4/I / DSM 18386 / JCM 14125) TaxID=453591 RepID=A8AA17_IGNH4|nr:proteasome-activating nucleotidase [Ignicoccus hospitalis]ABU81769.1 26S proteasome subunit P45 family [Ignicoccus hospitalis KIN4/I]HIH90037.1 proteasome-activating nucleotidase [Desulfurococcaceae archaeon]
MVAFDIDRKFGGEESDDVEDVELLKRKINRLTKEVKRLKSELEYWKGEVNKLTNPPLIEATLLDVLPDGRAVVKSSAGPVLVVEVSSRVPKELLKPGISVAVNQRGSTVVDVLKGLEDPYVKAMEVVERPKTRYSDVGGLKQQLEEVREVVELPLKNPEMFKEIGIEPLKGVLLYGPPGCGKTLIARAVAGEVGATFIRVVGSELVNKFIGEGARIVREVFNMARKKAPSIIFIDEIDAIAAKRIEMGTSGEREVQRTLMQLLAELDGFDPLSGVAVIAATNRLDILDPAILRPGRFDRIIYIPPPDKKGRLEILQIHTRNMRMADDVDLEKIAEMTEGATGADLKAIVTEAGYNALRNKRKYVTMEDFLAAVDKVMRKRAGASYRLSPREGAPIQIHTM